MSVFHASSAGKIGQPARTGPAAATPPSGGGGGGETTTPPSGDGAGGGPPRKGVPRLHAQRASMTTKRRTMVIETIGAPAFNPPEGRGSGSPSACSSGGQAGG